MDADHLEELAGVPGSAPFAPEPTTGRAVTQTRYGGPRCCAYSTNRPPPRVPEKSWSGCTPQR